MNKQELIEIIAAQHGLPKKEAGEILRTVLDTIQTNVVAGNKVNLVGFGVFERIHTKARMGFNPSNRTPIHIPSRPRPRFTPGRHFCAAVQPGADVDGDD